MHSVSVATPQCSCSSKNDIMSELDIKELQSSFSGYTLPYLSRPLIVLFYFLECESLLILLL